MDTRVATVVADEFGALADQVWLNTAHQGPLPRSAVVAIAGAAAVKAAPHRLADDEFTAAAEQLRGRLAALVHASPEQIVLGNSTSYGLHLVANGLAWRSGDEVLVVAGDYPATVLPWRRLERHGVRTVTVQPSNGALAAADVQRAITARTRVLALTWVDSFTDRAADLPELGAVCRAAGVLLVVNGSQALGARPLDVRTTPVDAVSCCGYKWLCGPYGTGFAWLHPALLDQLEPQQAYWLAMQAGRGLDRMRDTTLREDLGVHALDVFCPATFLNTSAWSAALDVILGLGVETIEARNQRLVERLLAGLDPSRYRLVSPADGPQRSTLVVLDAVDGSAERRHQLLTEAGIHTAYREGNLRLSVHLFNTEDQIDRTLAALHTRNAPDARR
jgi:selenocysteine lyase/cysteine desulfurase